LPPDAIDLDALAAALADRVVPLVAQRLRPDAEALLDRPALAERLGVGERTVSAMVAKQQLPQPLLCTGGVSRWSWPQVLRFLEGRQGRRPRRGRGRYGRGVGAAAEEEVVR
jgi:predicted DNA-binding transcriptional regulator AlpA